ncbi:hypothetical protein GWI33_015749 [Rhynchophorus ferrugineus]|uniref:Uncharacterized protein n=1 Tax=Rhynchophorus ferrugineus TaxID=354439 RepID=A0A834MB53_RHYFE|nr:hypothetical protein GWI33_015749 [Rhynchophorus ferrugineus]
MKLVSGFVQKKQLSSLIDVVPLFRHQSIQSISSSCIFRDAAAFYLPEHRTLAVSHAAQPLMGLALYRNLLRWYLPRLTPFVGLFFHPYYDYLLPPRISPRFFDDSTLSTEERDAAGGVTGHGKRFFGLKNGFCYRFV